MPARIPTIAPTRAPRPAEPTAQPTSAPRPMQTRSAVRRMPPAPAGSNEDEEAACIGGARLADLTPALVTLRLRQLPRFLASSLRSRGGRAAPPPRAWKRRQRRRDLGGPAPARRAVRARRPEPARLPARARRRACRLRGRGRLARPLPRPRDAPGRPLLRRHRLAPRGRAATRARALADRDRAAVPRGGPRQPGRRRVRARERGALAAPGRPGDVPPRVPRRRRSAPAGAPLARAPPGSADADGRAASVGGRDPVRGARRDAVSEARRLRRPQRGLRRSLRRPRASSRGEAR